MPDPIKQLQPADTDKQDAMNSFAAQMRAIRQQKAAAKAGLNEACATIMNAIRQHWSTGGGTRLRKIVWSIWNGDTMVNLYDAFGGLDYELARAVAKLVEAQLLGALDSDEYLRQVLTKSGEFDRYDRAAKATPKGEEVIYPPLSVSAERLRTLATAATNIEARYEAECRQEEARDRDR